MKSIQFIQSMGWKNINARPNRKQFKNIFKDIDIQMIDSTSKKKFLTSKLFLASNNYIAILDKECYTIKGMI